MIGRLLGEKRSPLLVGSVAAVLALLLVHPVVDLLLRRVWEIDWVQPFHFNDWVPYATATVHWKAEEVIYWQNSGGGYFGTYLYPPVYLLVMLPWFELGTAAVGTWFLPDHNADVAAIFFEVFSVGLLWVGLQSVARECGADLTKVDRGLLLLGLVGFFPLLFSVKLGQVSALVAAGFCFAFVAMERGRRPDSGAGFSAVSGALTVVTAGIKPYYATSGAHLLRNRNRFLGAVAGGVALAALSLAVFGVENHLAYLDVLLWGKGWTEPPRALYLWHAGWYEPWFAIGHFSPVLALAGRIGLVVGVVALSLLARDDDVRVATFALGLSIYPLVAPEVYTQDFVSLLVVAAVLVPGELKRDGHPWVPVVAVGLLHVHAYALRFLAVPADWLPFGSLATTVAPIVQPGLWGNLLLVGLAAYRVAQPVVSRTTRPGTALSRS